MKRMIADPERTSRDTGLRLAEVVSALSHALDMTDGQPAGHSVRCCWIGMHIGRELALSEAEMSDLYYTLLLKDLGCSSNAARICKLFVTSDHDFKRNSKVVDGSLPRVMSFIAANTAVKSGLAARLRAILNVAMKGGDIQRELIETRCERGADIARRMRFPEAVAQGILDLDEHWDGGGLPTGRIGREIALYARISLMAQVADVFHHTSGPAVARAEVKRRAGGWFDPELVAIFDRAAGDPAFWSALTDPDLDQKVYDLEPATRVQPIDDDLLDDIADGFSQVVDAKSPFTSGHSKRVAMVTDMIAEELGMPQAARRWLVRAALLHDVGKLGVSNEVLDKPGKLDADEWAAIKRHPVMGAEILSRIAAFSGLAAIAQDHHEKLDGTGYPRGLSGDAIGFETRIVTVADIFDALTADRPYRSAMSPEQALSIMAASVGTALDADCFDALTRCMQRLDRAAA